MSLRSHPENFHHLIPQVIDHLHRDSPFLGLVEGPGGVAVEGGPGVGVDFGVVLRAP